MQNEETHEEAIEAEEKATTPKATLGGFFTDFGKVLSPKWPWHERTTLEKSYTALSILMIIALLPMPYDFYQGLRVFTCIALYFFALVVFPVRADERKWFYVLIGLFVLYNPIIPIHFGAQLVWTILNIATLWTLYRARIRFGENGGILRACNGKNF